MSTTTRSGRTTKKPERFATLTFVAGSGFVGCDHYDGNYNNGHSYGNNTKDSLQAAQDFQYKKDLEKAMMVKETTQNLPEEMGREIQKCLMGTSNYQNDIDFIAPDNVEPIKEIADSDEEEWESGDDTSEDEEEWSEYDE